MLNTLKYWFRLLIKYINCYIVQSIFDYVETEAIFRNYSWAIIQTGMNIGGQSLGEHVPPKI